MKLYEQIKLKRKEKKITLQELGTLVDMTKSTLSMIENGVRDSQLSTIEKVIEAIGCEIVLVDKEI